MGSISVPINTLVPISTFSRGSASKQFAKVKDGVPVTVLKNNEPKYFIINYHDYATYKNNEIELANLRARMEAESGEGEVFASVDELMADLND